MAHEHWGKYAKQIAKKNVAAKSKDKSNTVNKKKAGAVQTKLTNDDISHMLQVVDKLKCRGQRQSVQR